MDDTTGSNLKTAKELSDDILADIEIHLLPISL